MSSDYTIWAAIIRYEQRLYDMSSGFTIWAAIIWYEQRLYNISSDYTIWATTILGLRPHSLYPPMGAFRAWIIWPMKTQDFIGYIKGGGQLDQQKLLFLLLLQLLIGKLIVCLITQILKVHCWSTTFDIQIYILLWTVPLFWLYKPWTWFARKS